MESRNICPKCNSKEWKSHSIFSPIYECLRCDHTYDPSHIPPNQIKMETFEINTNIYESHPDSLIRTLDDCSTPYNLTINSLEKAFTNIGNVREKGLLPYGIAVQMTDYLTENGYILVKIK